ncbi:MAG: TonB-dependent receptor, partial [Opitutaceae bacterium]|nr:TonB-dependent receptor [Opitutaceae bacterium]
MPFARRHLFPLVAACAARLTAAGTGDPVLFPTVVVEATGHGQPAFAMPYSTTVLDARALDAASSRSLPIALETVPGVMVQKTSAAQGAPYIRGFTGFRTLLLVDGIRLNHAAFREGPNQYWGTVDPLALARLELVRGPASVTYGSDAIGGTVNAVTTAPDLAAASGTEWRASHRFASADRSHTTRLEARGVTRDRAGAHVGYSHRRLEDLRAGRATGSQPRTGFEETALDGSAVWQVGSGTRLVALAQDFRQNDAWRTHSTIYGSRWRGTSPGSDLERSLDQERRLFALQLHSDRPAPGIDRLTASVSHQRQGEEQFRLRNDGRREFTGFDLATPGAFVRLHGTAPLGRWIGGAEFYRDRVDSHSRRFRADGSLQQIDIQGPVADDARYDLGGVFFETRPPRLGPVEFTAGARLNHATAEARRVRDPLTGAATRIDGRWRSVVGSLRALAPLDAAHRQNVFAGISQAFRAPNLSDLTRFDIAEGGQIETPAPGLEPERFVTTEAGWRAQGPRGSASIAAFHTAIRNQIIRTPTGARVDGLAEVTKRNSGAGRVQGVEAAAFARVRTAWAIAASIAWMHGDLDHYPSAAATLLQRAPLSRVMPLTAHGSVRWAPAAGAGWVELAASAASRQKRLAPADRVDTERIPAGGTPGYAVAHLRAGWRATPWLTLQAAIENLGDTDYRIHGS